MHRVINEPTLYNESSIKQMGIGKLGFEQMTYQSDGVTTHYYIIEISDGKQEEKGWGKVIFNGTLEELIALVNKANSEVEKASEIAYTI